MGMLEIETLEQLEGLKNTEQALLVLFGGKQCNVCHAIRPKLVELAQAHYPKVTLAYVDCHVLTEICSQNGVFTLPTLQVFFGGQRFIEEVRSFSLQKVMQDMARPYELVFED
jgi:thioredoxin-like negative regulator of GroEL